MEKHFLMTKTGEIYQPVRLYYELLDNKKVIKIFSKLRCMDFDSEKNRWVWLYYGEAKKIKLNKAYSTISKEDGLIIIGSFFIRQNNVLILDVRSTERAIEAIKFFDKYIKRSYAKITHMAIVNKVFDALTVLHPTLDIFFDSDKVVERNPERLIKDIITLRLEGKDENEFFNILKNEPQPEVEKIPLYYYDEGIQQIEFMLRVRQIEALEYWKGNTNFTFDDLIKDIL